jgi:hypothetical protein
MMKNNIARKPLIPPFPNNPGNPSPLFVVKNNKKFTFAAVFKIS